MSNGGLSAARLGRMHEVMAGHVERDQLPGLVTLVSRRGETHVDAIGMTEFDGDQPMRRDTPKRGQHVLNPLVQIAMGVESGGST